MSFDRQIKSALGAHGLVRNQILLAIKTGTSDHTPSQFRNTIECSFGQWIESLDGHAIVSTPEFRRCAEAHRLFHLTAANALKHALTGRRHTALESLDIGGEFANASMEFTTAMLEWSMAAPPAR